MLSLMTTNPLGTYIRERRAQLGISSQRELALKAGISHGYIANLERGYDYATGKQVNPSVEKLEQIARALRVTPEQLGAIARGASGAAVAGMSSATTDQPIGDKSETRKPWPLHDSSHADKGITDTLGGIAPGNELSTLGENPSKTDTGMVNLDRRTGDAGHIQMFPADLGPVRRLPVFRVSCGERVLINDEPQEWQTWPVIMTGPVDGIMIVEGTSMLGCGYQPGDQLFFQAINGRRPQDGDKVIAEVEGGAVCKLYKRDASGEYLVSAPGEATSFFARVTEAVRLVGIVKKRLTDG